MPSVTHTLVRIGEAVGIGNSISLEMQARRKDGSTFSVGRFMAPIREGAPGTRYYVGAGAGITQRLAQQKQQQQLQERLYSEMRERERMAMELRPIRKLEPVGRLAAGAKGSA